MGKEINRFIAKNPDRQIIIETMTQDLSKRLSISKELIQRFSQQALNQWESTENQSVINIFTMNEDARRQALTKIIDGFYDCIYNIVPSEKRLEKNLKAIEHHYENLFRLFT